VKNTFHEALHYAIFFVPLLSRPS